MCNSGLAIVVAELGSVVTGFIKSDLTVCLGGDIDDGRSLHRRKMRWDSGCRSGEERTLASLAKRSSNQLKVHFSTATSLTLKKAVGRKGTEVVTPRSRW